MTSAPPIGRRIESRAGADSDGVALFVPLGLLAAIALPFIAASTLSDEVHHEAKLFAQAAAAAVAVAGLALAKAPEGERLPPLLRIAVAAFGGAAVFAAASALANNEVTDPLSALSFLAPAALFIAAASASAAQASSRLFALLSLAGAATGALAFAQRFLGAPRLPLETPQPRFLATGWIGNPGDMAAALVIPALLLWAGALDGTYRWRSRLLCLAGFVACGLGLAASETVAAVFALGAGLAVHASLSPRRRLLPLGGALLAGVAVLAATGGGARLLEKGRELREGRLGDALTQRDIGLAAGLEMVKRAPVLGVGPGCFENAFARAHLAAEERSRRRMVHASASGHFENAHCEPLTLAAEVGIPAAVLGLASFIALVAALLRHDSPSRDVLVPPLLAFFVLSLASFPLRMPASAGAFAIVAGLAWRQAGGSCVVPPGRSRRVLLGVLAVAVLLLSGLRLLAARAQARGEAALLQAAVSLSRKGDILSVARNELSSAVRLRPRSPSAWLALGSCERLDGNVDRAWDDLGRSFSLEERAETDFNLGKLAFDEWDRVTAQALFVRAVWLLPRLQKALDEPYAPGTVELDVAEAERRFAATGDVPPLPAKVDALRLRRRFP